MTVSFSGTFDVYSISSNRTVERLFSQSLLSKIPNGVYCAEIDSKSEYLLIGSFASNSSTKQSSNGLSIWRILNEEPWIKQFDTVVDDVEKVRFSLLYTIIIIILLYILFVDKKEKFPIEKKFRQNEFRKNSESNS